MPELPEVEAARKAIEEHCVGKKVVKVIVSDDQKVINGVSSAEFQTSIVGKTIVASLRKGKNLWIQLDSPPFPSFQFGMAGAFYIKGMAVTRFKRYAVDPTTEWPSKYSKVFMVLDDGLELSFTDKRRFAKVRLLKDPTSELPISGLGPDALLEPMQEDEFVNSLSKRKIGIKALLLDQSCISGIGNWIADEVLYQSKIHPLQIASELSNESSKLLHRCIKEVIHYAVSVDADCSRFPAEWLFHFRWGKKSRLINGQRIDFVTAGGRTSAFVPEEQKLTIKHVVTKPGNYSCKRVSRKAKEGESLKDAEDQIVSIGKDYHVKKRCRKTKVVASRLVKEVTKFIIVQEGQCQQGQPDEKAENEVGQPLGQKRKKKSRSEFQKRLKTSKVSKYS